MPRLQSPRARAPYAAVLFVIATSALVGGIFGRDALATDDRVLEYQKTFSAALGAIESNYVETVDADRLVYGAIRGMLATLDPHSSFYDPKEYSAMRERQEGRYYGLGITILANNGDITASSVFEGSPAFKKAQHSHQGLSWRRPAFTRRPKPASQALRRRERPQSSFQAATKTMKIAATS